MSQIVAVQNSSKYTNHLHFSEVKSRIYHHKTNPSGDLKWLQKWNGKEWVDDYSRAESTALVMVSATAKRSTPANKLQHPKHIIQWIWKDHFGFTLLHPIRVPYQETA